LDESPGTALAKRSTFLGWRSSAVHATRSTFTRTHTPIAFKKSCDPARKNSLRGHDAAYNERAVGAMFQYAYNMCHVKDVLRTKSGEIYRVDIPKMFAVARASGYHGYFSMEFDTAAGDPFEGTKNLVNQSLEYMNGVIYR
jgi:hypothetical protein